MTGPIKAALNRRSKRKFDEFWFALQTVGDALMQAEQLAAKLRDQRTTNQRHQRPRRRSGVAGPGQQRRQRADSVVGRHPGGAAGGGEEGPRLAADHVDHRETVGSRTHLHENGDNTMSRTVDRTIDDIRVGMTHPPPAR